MELRRRVWLHRPGCVFCFPQMVGRRGTGNILIFLIFVEAATRRHPAASQNEGAVSPRAAGKSRKPPAWCCWSVPPRRIAMAMADGEFLHEGFVRRLETHTGSSAPSKSIRGFLARLEMVNLLAGNGRRRLRRARRDESVRFCTESIHRVRSRPSAPGNTEDETISGQLPRQSDSRHPG